MSTALQFDEATARQVEALYLTTEARSRRKLTVETLAPKLGERILDIGTGVGFLAMEMADLVGPSGRIYGIDLAEPMLDLARRRCAEKRWVEFQPGDAVKLPVESESIDGAVSAQVFEYVPNVEMALTELHRVLRPGGRAVVISTDWHSLLWHSEDGVRMKRVLAAFEEHCAYVSLPRILGPKLRAAGFEVAEPRVYVQFNHAYDERSYSSQLMKIIKSYVIGRKGVMAEEANAWAEEQQALGVRGEYFFCLNQFIYPIKKPR